MNNLQHTKEEQFQHEVLDSSVPVLVDFYAPWCGPCRVLAPVLEELAGDYQGRFKVVKVNVDESQELALMYGIQGVPTMMIFKDGEVVDKVVGLLAPASLRRKMDAVLAQPVAVAV